MFQVLQFVARQVHGLPAPLLLDGRQAGLAGQERLHSTGRLLPADVLHDAGEGQEHGGGLSGIVVSLRHRGIRGTHGTFE